MVGSHRQVGGRTGCGERGNRTGRARTIGANRGGAAVREHPAPWHRATNRGARERLSAPLAPQTEEDATMTEVSVQIPAEIAVVR